MAHTFIKAERIVDTTLTLLEKELVLGNLVWNLNELNWAGAKDDTVTLRVPAVTTARDYEWRTRTADIVLDDLTETAFPITIGGHVYHAVAITDEQNKLDIVDFGRQVLQPQTRAVAERLEGKLVNEMNTANFNVVVNIRPKLTGGQASETDLTKTNFYRALLRARRALNVNRVPLSERYVVIGVNLEEAVLADDQFVKFDQSGSDSALRNATIGRVAGFDIVVSQELDADTGIVFHRSAFGLATMAPPVPRGAPYGAVASAYGFAMRYLQDYDTMRLRDRSVVSAFYGTKSIEDGPDNDAGGPETASNIRAVKLDYDATATS